MISDVVAGSDSIRKYISPRDSRRTWCQRTAKEIPFEVKIKASLVTLFLCNDDSNHRRTPGIHCNACHAYERRDRRLSDRQKLLSIMRNIARLGRNRETVLCKDVKYFIVSALWEDR